jgi:hypothetical protein
MLTDTTCNFNDIGRGMNSRMGKEYGERREEDKRIKEENNRSVRTIPMHDREEG